MYSLLHCLDFGHGQRQPDGLDGALGHHRAELTMSPAGGSSTPWALFSMSKLEVSKVGLDCRDQAKGVCLIPLEAREVADRKNGHGGFALETPPPLTRSP